ncbi:hypothetical protein [Acinetobacter sp. ANC 5502]
MNDTIGHSIWRWYKACHIHTVDMTLILRFLDYLRFGYALKQTSRITLVVFGPFVAAIFALTKVVEYLIAIGRIGG